ncbi:hypothetical protein [Bacillus salacetis]|uniref:hypothetical protein n=1 Tax=Bacillus salacetis TaxID=2315464 RepID=UPI001443D82B|nr:hypothetical protein [Bacillus salacetis]
MAQNGSKQVRTYYGEMQEKQQKEYVGNFTENERTTKDITLLEDSGDDEGVAVQASQRVTELLDGLDGFKSNANPVFSKRNLILLITAIFLIIVLIVGFFVRKKRKKKSWDHSELENDHAKQDLDRSICGISNNIKGSAEEDIRKLIQNWQANLSQTNKKKKEETIREWFERINGPVKIIPIYEKVRYGEDSFTKEEYGLIKKELS